jgi:class 3 adenylate cyclase
MDTYWLVLNALPTLAIFAFLFAIFLYVVNVWHQREGHLREATERLRRAHLLVRRYVAPQVADHLAAHGYRIQERADRRTVTVCVSDIQDFAQTADAMEGEELSQVLHEYLSEMASIAERYGGTVHKFVGDGIIVLFGAPEVREPHLQVAAAVQMATIMQARVAELGKRWSDEGIEHPFRVRIGINTASAIVGGFGSPGRRDYTVIGSAVSTAARLQARCPAGHVLLGSGTMQFLGLTVDQGDFVTLDGLQAALLTC